MHSNSYYQEEKQKSQLSFSSIQKQEYNYCDYGVNSDEDRRWMD